MIMVVASGARLVNCLIFMEDVASRLAATEERERQFLMSVSHELRTPLTAIRGHVDALRDGVIDDPELIEGSLDVVAAEAERLERLVGDIVDLAKLRAHRFTAQSEEVDMGRLVEQAYGAFADEARRREIDYELVVPDEPPTLITDGDRVLQVIMNLLKNAFRWTPDGARIIVELRTEEDAVSVAVTDAGPGISQHDQERIFSPFVSRDNQGTGLGLPISRELAGVLGGSVELTSKLGAGSSFALRLPVRPMMAGPLIIAPSSTTVPMRSTRFESFAMASKFLPAVQSRAPLLKGHRSTARPSMCSASSLASVSRGGASCAMRRSSSSKSLVLASKSATSDVIGTW